MSGTLVSLIDFLAARVSCPACGAARSATTMPTQWSAHRAVFNCEAEFLARGEQILAERSCGDRSKLAAALWTKEATGQGRAVCVSPALDGAFEINQMILGLAAAAGKAGLDALMVCELVRNEMTAAGAPAPQDKGDGA